MTQATLYRHDGCRLWVWTPPETLTSEDMQARLCYDIDTSQIGAESRRRELLGIRLLTADALGADERIVYDGQHRPRLDSGRGFISIAHSKGIMAIAHHDNRPLGMDLEVFGRRMRRVRNIFLGPEEQAWQAGDDEQLTMAHLSWTAKEALFKIIGNPVYDFATAIRILPSDDMIAGKREGNMQADTAAGSFALHYWTTQRYAACIVLE